MSQKPLRIKFYPGNLLRAVVLLTLLSFIGPHFVDPTMPEARFFYFFASIMTAFMFPFVGVEKDEKDDN
jgi:hypothetical protein